MLHKCYFYLQWLGTSHCHSHPNHFFIRPTYYTAAIIIVDATKKIQAAEAPDRVLSFSVGVVFVCDFFEHCTNQNTSL